MTSKRAISLISAFLAGLLGLAFAASLYFSLDRYVTADEDQWLWRYDAFAQAPLETPQTRAGQANFSGMGNRILVGLPGVFIINLTGQAPLPVYRALHITLFILGGLLAAWWISRLAHGDPSRRRWAGVPVAALPLFTLPLVMAMARIINYDTIASLTSLLALIAAARAFHDKHVLRWFAVAGLFTGLAISTKAYGYIATAYIVGAVVVSAPLRLPPLRAIKQCAAQLGIYALSLLAGVLLFTPSAWLHPSELRVYAGVLLGLDARVAGTAAMLGAAALLGVASLALMRRYFSRAKWFTHTVDHFPLLTARILSIFLFIGLAYVIIDQRLNIYLARFWPGELPVVSETVNVPYSFGTANIWTERLANASHGIRTILYVLPEHMLVVLAGCAGLLVFQSIRRVRPVAIPPGLAFLLLFPVFQIGVMAAGSVLPDVRYFLPSLYAIAAATGLLLINIWQNRPRWFAAYIGLAAIAMAHAAAALAPHYLGYANLLRGAEDRSAPYGVLTSIWRGWGEGLDPAADWIRANHGDDKTVVIAADYRPRASGYPVDIRTVRDPHVVFPEADYYAYTLLYAAQRESTACIFTCEPRFANGMRGHSTVHVYDRNQIARILYQQDASRPFVKLSNTLWLWNIRVERDDLSGPSLAATLTCGDDSWSTARLSAALCNETDTPARMAWGDSTEPRSKAKALGACLPGYGLEIRAPLTVAEDIVAGTPVHAAVRLTLEDGDGQIVYAGGKSVPIDIGAALAADGTAGDGPASEQLLYKGTLDQRGYGQEKRAWASVGAWWLNAGNKVSITMSNEGIVDNRVFADALRLTSSDGTQLLVDDEDAACRLKGPWTFVEQDAFTGHGYHRSDDGPNRDPVAAVYTFTVPRNGLYELAFWRVIHSSWSKIVPVEIRCVER